MWFSWRVLELVVFFSPTADDEDSKDGEEGHEEKDQETKSNRETAAGIHIYTVYRMQNCGVVHVYLYCTGIQSLLHSDDAWRGGGACSRSVYYGLTQISHP